MNYGFRVVISSRFADIFRGNSGKQGLLTAQCRQDDVELLWKLLENHPGTSVTVDLVSRTVTAGDIVALASRSTTTPAGGCWRVWTTSASRSGTRSLITAYEGARPRWRPTVTA